AGAETFVVNRVNAVLNAHRNSGQVPARGGSAKSDLYHTVSTTLPVVSRPSSARCASAASASGNVAPTRKFSQPCSMPLKSIAERFANSSELRTNHASDGRERKIPPEELRR